MVALTDCFCINKVNVKSGNWVILYCWNKCPWCLFHMVFYIMLTYIVKLTNHSACPLPVYLSSIPTCASFFQISHSYSEWWRYKLSIEIRNLYYYRISLSFKDISTRHLTYLVCMIVAKTSSCGVLIVSAFSKQIQHLVKLRRFISKTLIYHELWFVWHWVSWK